MRRLITFACEAETLVGTLDLTTDAGDNAGLLIVSGGNEIRCGAHRGMSELAAALAAAGVPTLRFDRRGIGDSTGQNGGFESSAADIAAAADALRREAGVINVTAFGNCDAATALALFHAEVGLNTLVLSNPWPGATSDTLPPAAAIRTRYAERLRDPRQWLRMVRGEVDFRSAFKGLQKISSTGSPPAPLVARMAEAMLASRVPATILLASRDNTAVAFADAWAKCPDKPDVLVQRLDSASHSYQHPADMDWLYDRLHEVARYSAA